MGKTLVLFKLTVDDMEQLASVETAIQRVTVGEIKDIKRIPIGFGIETIKVAVLIPEKQDQALDEVTNALEKINHVENVEIESMTLL